ncbi:MAG: amidohydrolase family protein [Candidatus Hodarchaeota archaeon]
MSFPWNDRIPQYCSIINEISKSYKTYDIHLHPIEIVLNMLDYKEVPGEEGLFTLRGGKFIRPSSKTLQSRSAIGEIITIMKHRPQIISMMLRRAYNHTGPRVFREYFNILGIDRGLLLPVAPAEGSIDPQMSLTHKMFKGDARFCMAGSVPNTIRNQDVEYFLLGEMEKYHIIAVKIHPNVTGIDLNSARGKERIECIIEASARLDLPVIIHGGQNHLPNKKTGGYAVIANLKEIDFDYSIPVIIAHGGAYGYSSSEVVDEVIPVLKNLMRSHKNLSIDISGLDERNISSLLSVVEMERILFGSDALYENQIVMLMRLLFALEVSKLELENSLVQLSSKNAAKIIFKENPLKI